MSQPTITVHYLENSRATQFVAFLEELNLSYALKVYKRNAAGQAPPELRTIHPLGKSPVLELQIPGQQNIVLAEQAVMIEYLCDYFGQQLSPPRFAAGQEPAIGKETDDWKKWKYFMAYTEGSFNPYVLMDIVVRSKYRTLHIVFFAYHIGKS
jgi:glutathione S-transferase